MSINVTVTGNPVRISHGKMVTCDPSKSEFDKRRLMRLEQVRQQSKDIAENIRNKLKKEKSKCLSNIEKEGEVKLKNWQARKLLELQNQYQEALHEIGLAHKDAARVEDEEAILIEQEADNERVAKERGRAAFDKLQVENNERNLKKAAPIQRRKMTRDFENTRSNLVTNSKKDAKKKKQSQMFDSDSENRIPKLVGLSDSSEDSESSEFELTRKRTETLKACKEQQTSPIDFQIPTSDKALQTVALEEHPKRSSTAEYLRDTRISDRIKRRARLNPEVDYCDFADSGEKGTFCECCKCFIKHQEPEKSSLLPEEQTVPGAQPKGSKTNLLAESPEMHVNHRSKEPTEITVPYKNRELSEISVPHRNKETVEGGTHKNREALHKSRTLAKTDNINEQQLTRNGEQNFNKLKSQKTGSKMTKTDIPSKPKVTLRSVKDRPAYIEPDQPVQPVKFYDHPNRYSKSYVPKTSMVGKIDEEDLDISPNVLSEEEIKEKMRQRDKEAHLRGLAALEKEKLQREYKELLRKLPILQKQERICEIGMDKEKYHMSRDRLEELEKKRQNRLDNAYEELFVRKKPTITLPQRQDDKVEPRTLNLATWDTDFESTKDERTRQLEDLLTNLKSQKDSLLKEIEATVSKETLTQLVDSNDVKSQSTDYTRIKTRRKRNRDETNTSPIATSRKSTTIPTRTISPSPRKKPKLKKPKSTKKVTVLQNTSTQTTPQTQLHSAATSPLVNTPVTQPEFCTCPKNTDDLCEIVIKIKEDEKPEVVVNPPFMGSAIKITAEDIPKENEAKTSKAKEHKLLKEKDHKVPKEKESKVTKGITKDKDVSKEKHELRRNGSWGEHFNSTVSSKSSTSTSYRDLPKKSALKKSTPTDEASRASSSSASTMKPLDPRLLTYIKKLLSMSRASIDDLTVSAASEVSTPGSSIVETPSNNPLQQLKSVMKYFNINAAELQRQLSYSTDESSKHYNTSESLILSSSSEGEKSAQFKSCVDLDPNKEVLQQYADVTASCTKKISDLTAMIEKVRAEKKKMLQSSASSSDDKELTTTSYKDLPDIAEKRKSPTQEELDKQLLDIDYSFAEKLKQLTRDEIENEKKREIQKEKQRQIEKEKHAEDASSDVELLSRLKSLLDEKALASKKKVIIDDKPTVLTTEKTVIESTKDGRQAGIITEETKVTLSDESPPLFLDIPKLPKLEAPSLDKKKKKPPPSKGLRAITGNAPHELSTIVEADSQLSTKIEAKNTSGSDVPDILAEAQKKDKSQSNNSSDEVSEMETMETMLVSIGMEWAIPTLRKTREALALSSSSSSLSLRDFLSKISSSTSRSEDGSLSESQGVSLIQVDNRRTSTPIVEHNGKKEGPVFLTDSDLSSVKEHSNKDSEEKFYDLYEGSSTKTG